jgi:cytoskeletal protein RodZ
MKMQSKSESGVAHLQFLVLFAFVAVAIGFAGWTVMQNQDSTSDTSSITTPTTASAPSAIKTSADLNKAKNYLNQSDVDKDLNPDALNSDVKSLL